METPPNRKLEQDRKRRREDTPKEGKEDAGIEELRNIINKLTRTTRDKTEIKKAVEKLTSQAIDLDRKWVGIVKDAIRSNEQESRIRQCREIAIQTESENKKQS